VFVADPISSAYLPTWPQATRYCWLALAHLQSNSLIIVPLVWYFRLFMKTTVIHTLLGLDLASYSFFTAMPFGKSPHLAAVVSTLIVIIFATLGLVVNSGRLASIAHCWYCKAINSLSKILVDVIHRLMFCSGHI
jgi:hypothetical protein